MNGVLIYTEQTTPRLTYILDFIAGELLGLGYELIHDREKFITHAGPKFSYAPEQLGDELFFECARVLFENNITYQPINFCSHLGMMGYYLVSEKSAVPFDFFASAFLMLARYEEYLPNKRDKHDRFRGSHSLGYKAGILEKPMINYYALELKKLLLERYPELTFKQNRFEYTATFDIDMAYSYKEKGLVVNFGGFIRSLLFSDFKEVKNRFLVLMRGKKDPFDTYDYIFKVCGNAGIKTMFFFLLGSKSRFDKNISHTNGSFRRLIKDIATKAGAGLHLSYKSHISNEHMHREKARLEDILGHEVTANRFHYLRFQIPHTYNRLIKLGIKEDYTMGFAARVGFRAGTCTPYYFFNVKTNEVTNLKIYPFAFMDTTFTHYFKFNAEESLEKILNMMRYVKEVEGPFIALWHNSSFTEEHEWKGWREVFESVAMEAAALTQKQ